MQVGIREMYMKDNELLPGRKGIALSIEQWEELCKAAADVTQAIQNGGGKPQAKGTCQCSKRLFELYMWAGHLLFYALE